MVDVKEGRVLHGLRIEGVGSKGNSFVKYKGLIIFIVGTTPEKGETIDVKITKVGTSCAWGKIAKVSTW